MARTVAARTAAIGKLAPGNITAPRIARIGRDLDMHHEMRITSSPRNLAIWLAPPRSADRPGYPESSASPCARSSSTNARARGFEFAQLACTQRAVYAVE
jgi:hypothetical protein